MYFAARQKCAKVESWPIHDVGRAAEAARMPKITRFSQGVILKSDDDRRSHEDLDCIVLHGRVYIHVGKPLWRILLSKTLETESRMELRGILGHVFARIRRILRIRSFSAPLVPPVVPSILTLPFKLS